MRLNTYIFLLRNPLQAAHHPLLIALLYFLSRTVNVKIGMLATWFMHWLYIVSFLVIKQFI